MFQKRYKPRSKPGAGPARTAPKDLELPVLFARGLGLSILFSALAFASPLYTFQPIVPCSGCGSLVSGINNSGQIAGSAYDSRGAHAFSGSTSSFSIFDEPGALFTEAIGISNAGRVTVNYLNADGTGRAYILNLDGTKTLLPVVDSANYVLGGNVNEIGVAVGFYGNNFDGSTIVRAFVATGASLDYTFAWPGAAIAEALGINDAGVIVGEYYPSGVTTPPHGIIRNLDGTLQRFDVPGSISTEVFDINNSGALSGDYRDPSGVQHGFIYQNGIFSTLDFGANTTVFAINDLGQAAGASYPAGGFFTGPYSGFVAAPVPEPATWWLGLAGLAMVIPSRKVLKRWRGQCRFRS